MRVVLSFLLLCCLIPCLAQESADDEVDRRLFRPKIRLQECQLPVSVDNSRNKFFPPVISQTGSSCAQASGIGYMFTYEINRLLNRDASASAANRFSYRFSWNMVNGGQNQGGFVDEGLSLAKRFGMMTEADYGTAYTYSFQWTSGYDKYLNACRYRIREIYSFADSIPLMKRWLYDAGDGSLQGGLLTFSGMSTGWQMDDDYQGPSHTGYHSLLTSLPTSGSHAMTIVGYDDAVEYTDAKGTTHIGAFIVCNTWGTYSHDNGRYYYPYDFFRDSTVSNAVISDKVNAVDVCIHKPLVVYKVKLAYSSRNDLHFSLATSSTEADVKTAQLKWNGVYAFYNAGGDYPMQGSYGDETIELALDYTDNMQTANERYGSYFFNVVRSFVGSKKGSGKVLELSVVDYRYDTPQESFYQGTLPVDIKDGNNYFEIKNQADGIPSGMLQPTVQPVLQYTIVYDILGRQVAKETGSRQSVLPHGLYLFVRHYSDGSTRRVKVQK